MTGEGYFYLFFALLGAFALGALVNDIVENNAKRGDGWRVLFILLITLNFVRKLVTTI